MTEGVVDAEPGAGGAVRMQEADGHAYRTWNSATGAVTQEVLGAFAQRLSKYQSTPDNWVLDGFHGEEVNRAGDVVHKGARHLVLRDGMWMQPEPLLYLGLTNGNLRSPIGYTGVYAAGDTNALLDLTGLEPFTLSAVKAGAQRLDITPQLSNTVKAIVTATKDHQFDGGSDRTEFGAILNWGGSGGAIQVGGTVQEAGEGGGKVSGEGGAGTIHMHPRDRVGWQPPPRGSSWVGVRRQAERQIATLLLTSVTFDESRRRAIKIIPTT